MKCKIEKVWTLINPDGIAYRRFRTRFAKKIFFINEIDFLNHTELIMILDEQIILKEPVNQNFNLDKIQVNDKTLVIIKPKKEGLSTFRDIDPAKINVLKGTLPPMTGFEESLMSRMREEGFTSELKEENNAKETATDADGFIDITEPDFDELDYEEPDLDEPDFDELDYEEPDPDEPDFDKLDYEEPNFPNVDIDEIKIRSVSSGNAVSLNEILQNKITPQQQPEEKGERSVSDSDFLEKLGKKVITREQKVNFDKIKDALKNSKRDLSEFTKEDVSKKSSNAAVKPNPNLNDNLNAKNERKAAQKTDDSNIAFFKEMILLASKEKVDMVTKNKLFALVNNHMQSIKSKEIELLSEIKQEISNLKTIEDPPEPESLPKYLPPENLTKFLLEYNQDSILKYTCHEIDSYDIIDSINNLCGTDIYTLSQHQILIENRIKELYKRHYINHKIKNLILVYLTGKSFKGLHNKWSSDNIVINWKYNELIKWSEMNPGFVPNPGTNLKNKSKNTGYKFTSSIESKLTGELINSFSRLTIHFKHLFHIRSDNSLLKLISIANENEKHIEQVDFEINTKYFWETIELFTDVDKLIQAYNAIIRMIIKSHNVQNIAEKPKVKLTFMQENSEIIFRITHCNSIFQKTVENITDRIGDDHTNLIQNLINGLCDLYLKADFGNGQFAEINLWNGSLRAPKLLTLFKGVEHILIFRK